MAKFKPHGEKIEEFAIEREGGNKETFEIYSVDATVPGFTEYHTRLQPWIMFYIDAASYIDIDDPNWKFLTVWATQQFAIFTPHRSAQNVIFVGLNGTLLLKTAVQDTLSLATLQFTDIMLILQTRGLELAR